MENKTIHIILALLIFWLVSCDRPVCENDNIIFDNNEPSSKEYKDELVRQLKGIDRTKLTYWLQKYDENNGEEFLYFHIQGDNLCAVLHLSMGRWHKLEKLREKKGVGRRGAEFTNLKFNIIQDSLSTKFTYITFDKIID